MIGRIRHRDEFHRLRRDGRRVRIEPFWCAYLADPTSTAPRVAFAFPRAIGNAVTRNRLRRRTRAVLAQLPLTNGLYLIGGAPAASELTFAEIRAALARLPDRLGDT